MADEVQTFTRAHWTRFSKFVDVDSNDCWIWSGSVDGKGYGCFRIDGILYKAHRLSFAAHKGSIPVGLQVQHLCNNPACVNPAHLILGDNEENQNYKVKTAGQYNAIIDEKIARGIKGVLKFTNLQQKQIARLLGVKKHIVADIASRRTWDWVEV